MRRGKPWISAEQDPHFAALQFHRTARSAARLAWTHSTASRTTMPSRTGTRYETSSPPLVLPRQILKSRSGDSTSLVAAGAWGGGVGRLPARPVLHAAVSPLNDKVARLHFVVGLGEFGAGVGSPALLPFQC